MKQRDSRRLLADRVRPHLPRPVVPGHGRDRGAQGVQLLAAGRRRTRRLRAGVGSTIAFALAVVGRNHIRVDVFHDRFPPALQAFLNWLSVVLSGRAGRTVPGRCAWRVVVESRRLRQCRADAVGHAADLPAERLVRGVWWLFALMASAMRCAPPGCIVPAQREALNDEFHPKSAKEELKDELDRPGATAVRGDRGSRNEHGRRDSRSPSC